ncbi:hypothetical protein [Paenibacillus sp. FJAT-26967]|uniref:hypothetical protein n=1 Tax=Paenibacillus sp. FJAT-26967 TaxID=1729690 RepID=UPI000838260B|nr:hypothetical protein [Paenibacillus sp. FJAT-26967]
MILFPDKVSALEDFLEKHVFHRWQDDLMTIDHTYKEQQADIEAGFVSVFDTVCRQAAGFQDQGGKGGIRYLYFSFMRTSLLDNRPCYRIEAYDENWFMDTADCMAEWQPDFIFDPLLLRMAALEETRKPYARRITSADLDRIKQIEAVKYHLLTAEFIRNMLPRLLACGGYERMSKSPKIAFLAGEYRDQCELLHGSLDEDSSATGADNR